MLPIERGCGGNIPPAADVRLNDQSISSIAMLYRSLFESNVPGVNETPRRTSANFAWRRV